MNPAPARPAANPIPAADASGALAPIVLAVAVDAPPARAFDYFTRDIGRWWPLARFSCGGQDALDVRFEPQVGGGILERTRDGTLHRWGTVTAWAPGRHLRFTWHPGRDDRAAQWVELAFEAAGAGTRVTLTHGGWAALGDSAVASRNEYGNGWQTVFAQSFAGYCNAHGQEVAP